MMMLQKSQSGNINPTVSIETYQKIVILKLPLMFGHTFPLSNTRALLVLLSNFQEKKEKKEKKGGFLVLPCWFSDWSGTVVQGCSSID